jgi:glycosyltransferase involved in cell wall biosynthesis
LFLKFINHLELKETNTLDKQKSKKILYIWKGQYPWDVRVEKVCKSLISNGFEVLLLSRWFDEINEFDLIDGINIKRIGFHKPKYIFTPIPYNSNWYKAIEKSIIDFKPDLIIVREILLADQSGKLARKHKIPIIMDMAENYPAAMRAWKKYSKNIIPRLITHSFKIPDKVEKNTLKLMTAIITVCDEQNERLISQYHIKSENIEIVHNTPFKNWVKRENRITNDKIVFGHHGSTTDDKKIINFIYAFINVHKSYPNLELHLAGYGESFDEIEELINKTNSSLFIKILGKYNHNELQQLINSFDYGVLPYQISDFNNTTIHNKIFDYLAFGKPVLVSEAKPISRLVKQVNNGVVVDCEETYKIETGIIELLNKSYNEMSANSVKAFEEKYNWEIDEKRLISFVNKYINK